MSSRPSGSRIDLSKYAESDDSDDTDVAWGDIELPPSGISLNKLSSNTAAPERLNLGDDMTDNSELDELASISDFAPSHALSADSVSKFLSSYSGPGTVIRLSGSKRSVSSEHSDWGEDIVIPSNGFPNKFRSRSFTEDMDNFFDSEQDPVPSRASTMGRVSSLESVAEELNDEDLQFPEGRETLQFSSIKDPPLELNLDFDEADQGFPSAPCSSSSSYQAHKQTAPYTPESSSERWDDVIVPPFMTELKLVERKTYRSTVVVAREENWDIDIVIPVDAFAPKVEQNRMIKRKSSSPAPSLLKRNVIKIDPFALPHLLAHPASRTYARKALRQKSSTDSFSSNYSVRTPSSMSLRIEPRALPSTHPSMERSHSKPKFYGDGTELDDLDNLPIVPEVDERRSGYKIQRLNPSTKMPAPQESFSQLLNQFSEIDVKPPTTGKNKPRLIRNLNSLQVERIVGNMKYNPRTQIWEGNDEVLKDFDSVSPPRPALITNLGGNKKPRRVGDMIFDPERMKWFSMKEEDNPFDDIPDLTTADPQVKRRPTGEGADEAFFVDATFINSVYAAERQHKQFMSKWSMDSRTDTGGPLGHDHLFDIRQLPTNF